jgi:hypothetical protein
MWAEHIRTEGLPLFREDAHDSLSGFRFYLQTMEDFINKEEEEAVASIRAKFPEGAEINWSYHYPVHWEDIFYTQLRSSFIVSIVSFAEIRLKLVCKQVFLITPSPIEYNKLRKKGSDFDLYRKYLKLFGKFNNPSDELWGIINSIYLVRNCIVHNNNDIEEMSSKQLGNFVDKQPGLSATQGFLKIDSEFLTFSIDRIQEFVFSLYDELGQLCRSLRPVE